MSLRDGDQQSTQTYPKTWLLFIHARVRVQNWELMKEVNVDQGENLATRLHFLTRNGG